MRSSKALFVCLVVFVLAAIGHAQVTGQYAFGPFDTPGFDTINRGNLNVHLSIPIFSKPGRGGTNFVYALNYDGLIWSPKSTSGAATWTPAPEWGWTDVTNVEWGYVTYNLTISTCTLPPHGIKSVISTSSNYIYHDQHGSSHQIPYSYSTSCGGGGGPSGTGTYVMNDNSGYTLYRTSNSFVVFTKTGAQMSVPTYVSFDGYKSQGTGAGAASYTDTNGNQISVSSSGVFTDTMGKTSLSVSGAAPNPVVYAYTDSNGNPQTVTVNYGSYTIQTAFGVSGTTEYSQSNVPLVSSVAYSGDSTSYSFTYEQTPGNSSAVTGRIASVTLRTGGTISYKYTGGSQGIEPDGTTAGLTRTTSDGSTTYTRSNLSSTQSSTSIADALGNVTTATFLISSGGYFYEGDRKNYSGAATGTPLAEVQTCYNTTSPCSSTSVSPPFSTIVLNSYQNGVLIDTDTQSYTGPELLSQDQNSGITTTYTYDTYTGPYSIPFYRLAGVVSASGGTTFQETTYGYDETTPSSFTGSPQPVAVTTTRGNLTLVHQWISSSGSTLTTTNAYDTTGTIQSSTGPTGKTTLAYEGTGTFTTSITPPTPSSGVTLTTTTNYDPNTGLLTSTIDPNGTKTTYTYDGMSRASEIDSFDTNSNMVGKTTYTYYSSLDTGISNYQNASTAANTRILIDGYGRTSRIAVFNGQSSNQWYQTDNCYDAKGNLSFVAYRYQATGWGTSKVCSGAGDTNSYDALGRIAKAAHSDGTAINYSYWGHATQITDENGVSRIYQVDSLGRLTTVCEISSNSSMPSSGSPTSCGTDIAGTGFLTGYSYNLTNETTTVTQGAQTRVFQTDWLGRPISVTEPEAAAPTTYSYTYNSAGLLVTRQRPQANQTSASALTTTTTQYDSLGRPIAITYNDALTPTKNFNYDANPSAGWGGETGVNLKGRLAYIGSILGSNTATWSASMFSYDAMGRVINTWECGPTTCGTSSQASRWVSFSYDWTSNLTGENDPTAGSIGYSYSPANEITGITGSYGLNASCCGTYNLVTSVQNGPNGPLGYSLGNGLAVNASYDSLGRLNGRWLCNGSSQPSCTGGTQTYGFSLNWVGSRAAGLCDTVINKCMSYGYDEFARLTSVNVNAGTVQNFSYIYDRWGNRWQQNVTAGSGPSPQLTFNVNNNHVSESGYTYDAAGNLTSDGIHTYSYDAEGNLAQVDGGATASYTYDALNRRVHVQNTSENVDFTFDYLNRRITTWQESNDFGIHAKIYWGSTTSPIAFRAINGQTYFEHQDYLGTERMDTTYTGAVAGSFSSLPFGDGYSASGTDGDPYHFAELDKDYYGSADSQTDHAQFRQYSETQGRWLSPDHYSGSYDITNPQSMNRYAYVLNNPLSLTDPSGLNPPAGVGSDCANDPVCQQYAGGGGGGAGCSPDDASCGGGSTFFPPCCGVLGGNDLALQAGDSWYTQMVNCGFNPGSCNSTGDLPGETIYVHCNGPTESFSCFPYLNSLQYFAAGISPYYSNLNPIKALATQISGEAGWIGTPGGVAAFYGASLLGAAPSIAASLAELPTIDVVVGQGNPFHVAFGSDELGWLHADGAYFNMTIMSDQAAAWVRGFGLGSIPFPVLNPEAVMATEGEAASFCFTGACYALWNGWVK